MASMVADDPLPGVPMRVAGRRSAALSIRLPSRGVPVAPGCRLRSDRRPFHRDVRGAPKADGFVVPRQTNEFYHLCGIETPHAYLVLDARDRKATLYLPPRDPRLESAEGKVLSAEDADLVKRLTGVDAVSSTAELAGDGVRTRAWLRRDDLHPVAPGEGNAQCRGELQSANAAIAADYWDSRPCARPSSCSCSARGSSGTNQRPDADPGRHPCHQEPARDCLDSHASQLAGRGLIEAMKSSRPGVFEHQFDAVARYVFLAGAHDWRAIVPSRPPAPPTSGTCTIIATPRDSRTVTSS